MFFSARSEIDTANVKYENMSMQSLVKAIKANDKKATATATKTSLPAGKKMETTGTELKVYSSPNSVDSRPAVQTSDQLVRKLFKGLGVPLYDPRVPAMFLKENVPSAVKDYRWAAYDLTVNHDTMLSIVPPPPPPTPPPLPTPTPQQLISMKDIEGQKLVEENSLSNDERMGESVHDGKLEQNGKLELGATISVISPPENAKKRRLSKTPPNATFERLESSRQNNDDSKPLLTIDYSTEMSARLKTDNVERQSSRAESSRNPNSSMKFNLEAADEKPEVSHTPQLSARVLQEQQQQQEDKEKEQEQEEQAAMMRSADNPSPKNSRLNSRINSSRFAAVEPGSARIPSAARVVDYSQKGTPEVRDQSKHSQRASSVRTVMQDEREMMLPADSDAVLEKKFSGLAVQQMSAKSPQAASSRGKNYSFEGGDNRDNEALSIETLLDLNSPESQWNFLKEVAPASSRMEGNKPSTGAEKVGTPAAAVPMSPTAAAPSVSNINSPVQSPPAFIPPVPISSPLPPPSPTNEQQQHQQQELEPSMQQQDFDRSPADTEYHEFQRSLQQREQHATTGKVISPGERSVFKPTFAAPRPVVPIVPKDANASLLVSDRGGVKAISMYPNAAKEETPSFATVGETKKKRNGYGVLEDVFLAESPPPRPQHIQAQQYGKQGSDDDYYAEQDQQQLEEDEGGHKFSRHRKSEGAPAAHKGKHRFPSHWYMAGAYSSHSEAMEAIGRLNKLLAAQSPNPDGGDDDGGDNNPFRLQRDLSRMQWVVECNDLHNKAAVLSHTSKAGGSHEKDKAKYRNIVSSLQKEEQAVVKQQKHLHSSPSQLHGDGGGSGGGGGGKEYKRQLGQGQQQVSPEAHFRNQPKQQSQQQQQHNGGGANNSDNGGKKAKKKTKKGHEKDDKYLRDRDLSVEQNLRAIRLLLPKDDNISPPRAARTDAGRGGGGTRFPPINQQQKKGKGGGRK